jgi:ABC-2 type transport system permease protein
VTMPVSTPQSREAPRRRAPSVLHVAWLIAALALRRTLNRVPMPWRRRAKEGAGELARPGTRRKGAPGRLLLAFVSLTIAASVVTSVTQMVSRVALAAEQQQFPDVVVVSRETLDGIDWVVARDPARVPNTLNERRQLLRMFEYAAADEGIALPSARDARAEALTQLFERTGRSAFRASEVELSVWPTPRAWLHRGDPLAMLAPLGLIGGLLALAVSLFAIIGPDRDLSRVESSLEWWFTFPVSVRALLLARVLESGLVSPLLWIMVAPFYGVVFWCAGFGYGSVPLMLLATTFVGLLAGSLRVATETTLRAALSLPRVALAQAALQLLGSLLLALAFTSLSHVGLGFLIARARTLPVWALFNPFSLPFAWLLEGASGLLASGVALLLAPLAVGSAIALGGVMLRDGLLSGTGPLLGVRGTKPTGGRRVGSWLGPVAQKELTSLTRDTGRLTRVVVTPLLAMGFQGLLNPAFHRAVMHEPEHAAAAAFATGGLLLTTGALLSLATESPALWLLHTLPRSLDRILLHKALFWSCAVTLLTALALLGLSWSAHEPALVLSVHAALALVGVALYAFIAVALGALGTDMLETELKRRTQPATARLFMLLSGLFAYALYTPSWWAKFAQLCLSSLLAYALWQKVHDHTPYLLDPTEEPPRRIGVADGILAALAFFVAQGLLTLLFKRLSFSAGPSLVFAFVGAGLLVTLGALYVFAKAAVPELAVTLGLAAPDTRPMRALLEGIGAGLLGGGVALGYTLLIAQVGWLRELYEQSEPLRPTPELMPWLGTLAVFAAPLFEEFIFRGVLYRGFRRSLAPLYAALASGLVFALVHPPQAFVPVFVLGLLAARVFERSRLLLAPIAAHMTYNAIVVGLAALAP